MIITTKPSLNIKALEKVLLENIFQEKFSESQFQQFQLSCFPQEDNLVILLHAPETILRQKAKLWRILRQTLLQEEITHQVLVYLILQDKQPPQIITHTINLSGWEPKTFNPGAIAKKFFKSDTTSIVIAPVTIENTNSIDKEENNRNFYLKHLFQNFKNNHPAKLFTGGGISLVFFLALAYALSQPCVLGSCEVIPQARQLGANSTDIFTQQPTLEQLTETQQQLLEAIKILETIPWWSSYYHEAKKIGEEYQKIVVKIEKLITGLNYAKKAYNISQLAPLSETKLLEVKLLWEKAIATLQHLTPDDTSVFVQAKIKEYQGNVNYINQQIKLEQQDRKNLKAAQEAIKIAEARQSVSQTLANWQLVEATWRTVINKLKAISPTTKSYQQAKQLITNYEPKLLESIKQKAVEERAINSFNQAVKEAKLAKDSELLNQWSFAVGHWRNAVTYVKQIPINSFQYTQAQPLIDAYQQSFEESQVKLRAVLKLQNANSELEKICSALSKICNYLIRDNTIQVHLTPTYVQDVWQSALEAKAQGNFTNQVQILNHISTLEKNLETISKNTGIPVEVYNSDGVLMLTYKPQ